MDYRKLLLGEEEWSLLWQIPLRALVMFLVALILLRVIGKRAVPQGVFEVLIIVILGSAAGDPLIYESVGILPPVVAFVMVLVLYKGLDYLVGRNKKTEYFVEGKYSQLIRNGVFEIQNINEKELMKDEIFEELRLNNVSQLGQVRAAYIEATGKMSVFYFENDQVLPGLPVFPDVLCMAQETAAVPGPHACRFCGSVQQLPAALPSSCSRCGKKYWLPASTERRVQ